MKLTSVFSIVVFMLGLSAAFCSDIAGSEDTAVGADVSKVSSVSEPGNEPGSEEISLAGSLDADVSSVSSDNSSLDSSVHAKSSPFVKAGCIRLYTGDVITLSDSLRNYIEPFPNTAASKNRFSALVSWDRQKVRQQRFRVNVVSAARGTITLRSVTTRKFLNTDCCHNRKTLASLTLTTSPSVYRLVQASSATSGKVKLQDIKTRKFLISKRFYGRTMFYEFSGTRQSGAALRVDFVLTSRRSVIVSRCVVFRDRDVVALRTEERTFFKRFYPFPVVRLSGLLAYQKNIDPYSKFTVFVKDGKRLFLRADNNMFLKRFCCWKGGSVIAIYLNKVDRFSTFSFRPLSGSKVYMMTENKQFVTLKPKAYRNLGASVVAPRPDPKYSALQVLFI